MRSYFLTEFRQKLSQLNNSLSHYIFVWEQFYEDNKIIIKDKPTELTTIAYSHNKNAKQFSVKLETLSTSNSQTYDFILKSLFLFGFTKFEVYLKSIYEFARKLDSLLPTLTGKEKIPDDIFKHWEIYDHFEKEELYTFDYIRLRRNRFVHSAGETKGDLADLIRNKGDSIQKYWDKHLFNGTFGINFKSKDTELFTKEEIFDLINIWHNLIGKTDSLICEKMNRSNLINNLKHAFIRENRLKIKSWSIERRIRKFNAYCGINFELILSPEELKNINISDVA